MLSTALSIFGVHLVFGLAMLGLTLQDREILDSLKLSMIRHPISTFFQLAVVVLLWPLLIFIGWGKRHD